MKPLHYKKHTLAKRGLSLLCVLALCLGLLPVTALAATVENITYLDENGTQQTAASATQVTNSDTQWTDGWYVAQSNITIDGTVTISGNVHLILEDGCSLTVNGGILLQSDGNMYIYAQSTEKERMGSLTATGTDAGFKEAGYDGMQTLTIAGGKISASGSDVGISAVNLTITDGYVSALGTDLYGDSIAVYNATISGGFVDLYGDFTGTLSTGIDGHAVISSTGEIKNIAADCKGFFLIQKTGKIYGDTFTLTQDLNIANSNIVVTVEEGQTLTLDDGVTLTIPVIATLTNNGIVNNNGTIINTGTLNNSGTLNNNGNLNNTSVLNNAGSIINNGTLTGEVGGSGTVTPKITTDSPLPEGTVGESYTATLEATGNNITWSASGLPDGLTLNESTGTISGTPTTADTYTFTVTATNASGSDSKEYTLNIKSATVPVTGVTLNPTSLSLFTGDNATLTATVEPGNATNKNVTWSSDKPEVATVENGEVTAKAAGTVTITATAADGSGVSATCTVTVTDKTYTISADPTALNFGSAYTGYAQPAAQTVTLTNTGNQPVTLTQPASTNSFEVGTLSKMELAAGETATFTVQPKAGLSAGTYSDTITVSGTNNATSSIIASFTVKSQPSYNPPTVSEETTDAIKAADPGETVTVDLSSGSTKLDKEVFETLAGQDITLVIDLGDGLSWTVNGTDIPEDADFVDIDMGVTMDSDGIPVDLINAITGEHGSVQVELAHNGAFGFTMTLTAPLGEENAGYWANLYHFDEDTNAMTFETAAQIGSDGSVSLPLSHASQYAIVIDDHNHGVIDLPFTDVADSDWFYDPVCYVYENGLMTGTSDTNFEPNTHLSRAMLVAVLHRLEGSPQASGSDFTDVAEGDWYAQAVNWAASVGVVNGFDDGTFQPNTAITREQMAAILRNYAAYKGLDVTATGDLSAYTDAASVSDWAKESVEWMVGNGLIGGYEDSTLRPQGNTTRAEAASMLQRYLDSVTE